MYLVKMLYVDLNNVTHVVVFLIYLYIYVRLLVNKY